MGLILAMQGGFDEQLPDDRPPDGLSAAAVGG